MPEPLYADVDRSAWIRSIVENPWGLPAGAHLGLWYDKFFDGFERESLEPESEWTVQAESKHTWIETVTDQRGRPARLREQCRRRRDLVSALGGSSRVFEQDWHFVTGLGLPHPLENGFAWHPTLGLPYLPATSVKGMLRAWVEVWADLDEATRAARVLDWFGSTDRAGRFIFFDALPAAPVQLAADVMTPHRGRWYAEGGLIEDAEQEPERVPADWHSPNIVPFLVVESGSFLVSVAPRDPRSTEDAAAVSEVFDALGRAFAEIGAGAKTAVGYGRWVSVGSGGKEAR